MSYKKHHKNIRNNIQQHMKTMYLLSSWGNGYHQISKQEKKKNNKKTVI